MSERDPQAERREADRGDRPEPRAPGNEGRPDPQAPEGEGRPATVSRRTALKVLAAGAAVATLPALSCADEGGAPGEGTAHGTADGPAGTLTPESLAAGTAADPDLIAPVVPWEPLLTKDEMRTVAALCDVIIPADDRSPAASQVGAHDFVNEWVSAPYDGNREDLVLVRGGLIWLNVESEERFGAEFAELETEQQHAICDEISYAPDVPPGLEAAARFFDRMRDLTSTAFWTTEEGMRDLGYVGNVPLTRFDGPPREVLERLGLV